MTNAKALEELGAIEFDASSELTTPQEVIEFLQSCIEEAPDDAPFIAHALGVVARAQVRMAAVAGHSGLSRESLYKALSGRRDPSFSTILKVVSALGLRLQFVQEQKSTSEAAVVRRPPHAASVSTWRMVFGHEGRVPEFVGRHYATSVQAKSFGLELPNEQVSVGVADVQLWPDLLPSNPGLHARVPQAATLAPAIVFDAHRTNERGASVH